MSSEDAAWHSNLTAVGQAARMIFAIVRRDELSAELRLAPLAIVATEAGACCWADTNSSTDRQPAHRIAHFDNLAHDLMS